MAVMCTLLEALEVGSVAWHLSKWCWCVAMVAVGIVTMRIVTVVAVPKPCVCQTLLLDLDVGCRDVSVQKVGMKLAKETCTGDEIGLGLVDRLRLELNGEYCAERAEQENVPGRTVTFSVRAQSMLACYPAGYLAPQATSRLHSELNTARYTFRCVSNNKAQCTSTST